jgi:hypothetical protein
VLVAGTTRQARNYLMNDRRPFHPRRVMCRIDLRSNVGSGRSCVEEAARYDAAVGAILELGPIVARSIAG